MKRVDSNAPAYDIVERKIKDINPNISIEAVGENINNGTYIFSLSGNKRSTDITFSEEFLEDLRDCPRKGKSKNWVELDRNLTNSLVKAMEDKGLIEYSKEKLKELIYEHLKEQIKSHDHVNKFNLLGKPYRGAEGSLERSLGIFFSENERARAGLAFNELRNQGVIVPTYKDLVNPEDWVKLGEISNIHLPGQEKGKSEEEGKLMTNEKLRAFISYSSENKLVGAEVKKILDKFDIDSFLAHDDIHVSEEWKERIIEELNKADIFIVLLSDDFKKSDWAPQETGIAYNRRILIIPLRLDATIPFGFIGHLQGKPISKDNMPLDYLIMPIIKDFPKIMIKSVLKVLRIAGSYRYAENVMALLVPHYSNFEQEDVDNFVEFSIKNDQVWNASLCGTEYIPKFIDIHKNKINPDKLKELLHLIKWEK